MFVFSKGHDSCIGQDFVHKLMKAFIPTLLQNYTIELVSKEPTLKSGPLAMRLDPVTIILKSRL